MGGYSIKHSKPRTEIFQQLSEAGFSIVPVNGKAPFEMDWTQACTTKRDYNPAAFNGHNAGIACGPASGILALDPDHLPKFEKYCSKNGWVLPRTRKHRTGSGNYHLLYKYPRDGHIYGNKSISDPEGEINPRTGKVWTIFDVRGLGGQIVAPGSIHPDTGEYYEVEDDHPIVDAPECLLRLYDEPEFTEEESRTEPVQYSNWDGNIDCLEIDQEVVELVKNGTLPGTRSDKLFYCLKVLIKAGLTDNQIIQLLRKYPNGIASKWLNDKRGKFKWINGELSRARQKKSQSKPKPTQAAAKPSQMDVAKAVIASFGPENILESQSSIWTWRNGVWKKIDTREVKQKIHAVAAGLPVQLNKSFVESVCDLMRTEVYRSEHKFDVNQKVINCLNGELNWINNGWELKPHYRENYRTTQIPVVYDRKAIARRFEQFLNEVFRDDPDKFEKKQIVLEMIGYAILATCAYEKFFILIGPGANGKSVLMDTIAELVGPDNVAAVQPSQFENKFQRAHLQGKLVNLVCEIAEGHEVADAQLKAIVSGELTTAEHKLQKPFEFSPFATCIFGTNHMPHTRDFSEALFRRAIVLTFNRKFQEHEQDKHLREKLRAELPGILNLALMAIGGVFRRGGFTMAASVEERKTEWRIDCDQVAQFVDEMCVLSPEFQETSYKLFNTYEQWTRDAGVRRTLNRKNFTQRLQKLGPEPYKGTGGVRMIQGISVRN